MARRGTRTETDRVDQNPANEGAGAGLGEVVGGLVGGGNVGKAGGAVADHLLTQPMKLPINVMELLSGVIESEGPQPLLTRAGWVTPKFAYLTEMPPFDFLSARGVLERAGSTFRGGGGTSGLARIEGGRFASFQEPGASPRLTPLCILGWHL